MQAFTDFDRTCMARALELAAYGLYTTTPNPRVGCVIAVDGAIIGEGFHEHAGGAHAEVKALAHTRMQGRDAQGATMYVTLEPCNHHGRTPPCVDAIIAARIGRVIAAMADPNPEASAGASRLQAAAITVEFGLCENQSRELNAGFISRVTRARPWVRSKIAASLDGRTALISGTSQWITGVEARADGHAWRARACAILTGIGTVLHDDPQLNVREVPTPRQPLRVIVDRHGQTPASARVLDDANVLIVTAGERNPAWTSHAEAIALPDPDGRVDLPGVLRELAARGINELHVEAGAKLNGALLDAGLIDELLLYVAPHAIGDPARGMFERGSVVTSLAQRLEFTWHDVALVGPDLRLRALLAAGSAS